MTREAHAEAARRKKGGGEGAELIPFTRMYYQSSALFPGQSAGFGADRKRDMNSASKESISISPGASKKLSPPSHETALLQWMAEGP